MRQHVILKLFDYWHCKMVIYKTAIYLNNWQLNRKWIQTSTKSQTKSREWVLQPEWIPLNWYQTAMWILAASALPLLTFNSSAVYWVKTSTVARRRVHMNAHEIWENVKHSCLRLQGAVNKGHPKERRTAEVKVCLYFHGTVVISN